MLRRGKRPQGKIADPLNRKRRGFFPFWGESSVFFFVIEAFGTNAQPASGGCSTQRVWDYPNKHFATQKWRLYIRTPCLLSKPYLLFLPLLILQSGKGKMAVSAKKNRKRPRLNLHSWCDSSWLWLHKEYKLTFPGWCCKLLLALANHKEGAHT